MVFLEKYYLNIEVRLAYTVYRSYFFKTAIFWPGLLGGASQNTLLTTILLHVCDVLDFLKKGTIFMFKQI